MKRRGEVAMMKRDAAMSAPSPPRNAASVSSAPSVVKSLSRWAEPFGRTSRATVDHLAPPVAQRCLPGEWWPGGKPLPKWLAVTTTTSLDATAEMWAFCAAHPLRSEWTVRAR
jgi:hypothetical protein